VDFLLECIGFPPDHDLEALVRTIREHGEPVAWRGPKGTHLRYSFPGGLDVRLDREGESGPWSLWPYFEVSRRLRVAVTGLVPLPDSPYDVLLHGTANPPLPDTSPDEEERTAYPICTYLCDSRRMPRRLRTGHVLAVSIAGFALDVSYVGSDHGATDTAILDRPHGAGLAPLAGEGRPGGCMEVSLRVRTIRHLLNPLTQEDVQVIEADAPGRPLDLFVSRWQLSTEGFERPRPGGRIEGVFLFTGRLAGGLPRRAD
jgi:hypothetical protein